VRSNKHNGGIRNFFVPVTLFLFYEVFVDLIDELREVESGMSFRQSRKGGGFSLDKKLGHNEDSVPPYLADQRQ
jgi:hypothetical protein